MTFEKGERIAVYFPEGRKICTVKTLPYMPYIVVEEVKTERERRVHPKQCRKLKKRELTKGDFKPHSIVNIDPAWSRWFCEHLDVYYRGGFPNHIEDKDKVDVALHMIVSLQELGLKGTVVGYGVDGSVRVEVDGTDILPLYGKRATYIGVEYLTKAGT
jgi:hypothetical protein